MRGGEDERGVGRIMGMGQRGIMYRRESNQGYCCNWEAALI